jgi:hypothetical protein
MTNPTAQQFTRRLATAEERFGVIREPVGQIPIITLASFMNGGSDEEKRAVAAQLREASINIG